MNKYSAGGSGAAWEKTEGRSRVIFLFIKTKLKKRLPTKKKFKEKKNRSLEKGRRQKYSWGG
jgi:hypothetical protein